MVMQKGLNPKGKPTTRAMGHSKAWQTLTALDKEADRSCIGCHSIGFMQSGGYCKASEVDFRKDVQCESCHGPGSLHAQSGDKALIKRTVPEAVCRSCHHVPHIQSLMRVLTTMSNSQKYSVKAMAKSSCRRLPTN